MKVGDCSGAPVAAGSGHVDRIQYGIIDPSRLSSIQRDSGTRSRLSRLQLPRSTVFSAVRLLPRRRHAEYPQ